ncbi:barstar family protein [Streptomyces sp. NPDC086023]|uniref:barstar family protein n=1 Tax=Streptomyces sp. NPDC086023 TaxID=3365746 RepID=UPI0037D4D782
MPFDLTGTQAPWVIFGPRDSRVISDQIENLVHHGGRVRELSANRLLDVGELFQEFSDKFSFPAYFGRNWDAMVDCLDDLCESVTDGVGVVGVIRGADVLMRAEHLKLFVSVLCQGADRANSSVDLDGEPRYRPAVIEHFVFLMDECDPKEVAARIEHSDLLVTVEGEHVTAELNPEVWFS